jgi:hypothetical protein
MIFGPKYGVLGQKVQGLGIMERNLGGLVSGTTNGGGANHGGIEKCFSYTMRCDFRCVVCSLMNKNEVENLVHPPVKHTKVSSTVGTAVEICLTGVLNQAAANILL